MNQSFQPKEVIVVYDGPEQDLQGSVLEQLPEEVMVLFTGEKTNGNFARNLGVRAASADLVAFLDDDDLWEPEKLASQLLNVPATEGWWLQTTSVRVVEDPTGKILGEWPGTGPQANENLGDYFFVRHGLRQVPRFLQTSTWLAPRDLFLAQPFNSRQSIHQDWDWIIRAQADCGVQVVHISHALVSYTRNLSDSTSTARRFNESRDWVLDPNLPLSKRARGDFILHMLLTRALREGMYREALSLPKLAHRVGAPSFWGLIGGGLRLLQYGLRGAASSS